MIKIPRLTAARFSFVIFIILASLDNAAAGVLPPLYAIVSRDLATSEASLGSVTSLYILITAISAIYWGYRGDQGERKQLLLWGTLIWGAGMGLTALAQSFWSLLLWQSVTALGVGAIGSVGFSVISDYIPAHRRGLALSLWSMAQTIGVGIGTLLASTLGAFDWRWPFVIIAALGFLFAFLYTFTIEPPRGHTEPELANLFAQGHAYTYQIQRADIRYILANRANVWLLIQTFLFSLAYGSTLWVPRWAIARVQAEGYNLETATVIGNLFVTLFSIGVFFAIPAGHLGDIWQKRRPHGRTELAMLGLFASIPFFVLLYFIPLRGVEIPETENLTILITAVFTNLFRNGWVIFAFAIALIGMALFSLDGPNWAAMIVNVNLPEHRGTFVGITRLIRAIANAISVTLTGFTFAWLTDSFAPPQNYAVGLTLFQILVIPTALCYFFARRTIPHYTQQVKQTLAQRSQELLPPHTL